MSDNLIEIIENTSHKLLIIWARDCALHVINFFEELHPDDLRPRSAIKAIDKWINNELTVSEVRKLAFSSHAAAREAIDDKAIYAARSAGHAAATIHVKTHAIHAANYALKVFGSSEENIEKEYIWQYERLENIKNGQSI